MKSRMILESSCGTLVVDPATGVVDRAASKYVDDTDPDANADGLRAIYKIDIAEWLRNGWNPSLQRLCGTHDILDFGYWFERTPLPGFGYEPPTYAWREGLAWCGWEYYPIPPDRVGNIVEDMATIRRLVGSGCYEWQSRNGRIFVRRCE